MKKEIKESLFIEAKKYGLTEKALAYPKKTSEEKVFQAEFSDFLKRIYNNSKEPFAYEYNPEYQAQFVILADLLTELSLEFKIDPEDYKHFRGSVENLKIRILTQDFGFKDQNDKNKFYKNIKKDLEFILFCFHKKLAAFRELPESEQTSEAMEGLHVKGEFIKVFLEQLHESAHKCSDGLAFIQDVRYKLDIADPLASKLHNRYIGLLDKKASELAEKYRGRIDEGMIVHIKTMIYRMAAEWGLPVSAPEFKDDYIGSSINVIFKSISAEIAVWLESFFSFFNDETVYDVTDDFIRTEFLDNLSGLDESKSISHEIFKNLELRLKPYTTDNDLFCFSDYPGGKKHPVIWIDSDTYEYTINPAFKRFDQRKMRLDFIRFINQYAALYGYVLPRKKSDLELEAVIKKGKLYALSIAVTDLENKEENILLLQQVIKRTADQKSHEVWDQSTACLLLIDHCPNLKQYFDGSTILIHAAKPTCNADTFEIILDRLLDSKEEKSASSADYFNFVDGQGRSAVSYILESGDPKKFNKMLMSVSGLDLSSVYEYITSLKIDTANSEVSTMLLLSSISKSKSTQELMEIFLKAKDKHFFSCSQLLKIFKNQLAYTKDSGCQFFQELADKMDNVDYILDIHQYFRIDLNIKRKLLRYYTPLQWAIYNNDLKQISKLLKEGADPRIHTNMDINHLVCSVYRSPFATFEFLLDRILEDPELSGDQNLFNEEKTSNSCIIYNALISEHQPFEKIKLVLLRVPNLTLSPEKRVTDEKNIESEDLINLPIYVRNNDFSKAIKLMRKAQPEHYSFLIDIIFQQCEESLAKDFIQCLDEATIENDCLLALVPIYNRKMAERIDLNTSRDGLSPIFRASINADTRSLIKLLQNGADGEILVDGITPLMFAAKNNNPQQKDIINTLLYNRISPTGFHQEFKSSAKNLLSIAAENSCSVESFELILTAFLEMEMDERYRRDILKSVATSLINLNSEEKLFKLDEVWSDIIDSLPDGQAAPLFETLKSIYPYKHFLQIISTTIKSGDFFQVLAQEEIQLENLLEINEFNPIDLDQPCSRLGGLTPLGLALKNNDQKRTLKLLDLGVDPTVSFSLTDQFPRVELNALKYAALVSSFDIFQMILKSIYESKEISNKKQFFNEGSRFNLSVLNYASSSTADSFYKVKELLMTVPSLDLGEIQEEDFEDEKYATLGEKDLINLPIYINRGSFGRAAVLIHSFAGLAPQSPFYQDLMTIIAKQCDPDIRNEFFNYLMDVERNNTATSGNEKRYRIECIPTKVSHRPSFFDKSTQKTRLMASAIIAGFSQ